MKKVALLFALVAAIGTTCSAKEGIRFALVPETRVVDAKRLVRTSRTEREVVVANNTAQMLLFHLDRRPIASIAHREALRLYLPPGRYRFGVRTSSHVLTPKMFEANAEITNDDQQIYRVFQSSGFSSSGGNATYDITPVKQSGNANR